MGFSLVSKSGGSSPLAAHGLLIAVTALTYCGAWALGMWVSVVVTHGLSSCGVQAQLPYSTCDLPRPGIRPVPPLS